MRTLTADQDQAWALSDDGRQLRLRISITDDAGAWRDLTALEGSNWVLRAEWGGSIDNQVNDARVTLKRNEALLSLAPELAASKLNRSSVDGSYGPILAPFRALKIEVAATGRGQPAASTDWVEAFYGLVDIIDPGAGDNIEIQARDPGGRLQDVWIEDDDKVYGDPAGSPVETEMQIILNQAAGLWGAPAITLYTPVSPAWDILEYNAESGPVMDELVRLAQQIGWVCRFWWDSGTSAWRLTLFEPDRSATTPGLTIPAHRIRSVGQATVNISTIRNVIKVRYNDPTLPEDDATSGWRTVVASDSTSIALYGRRFMEISEEATSNLDTSTEAQRLADAALADLKDPVTHYEATIGMDPRVELYDLVRFESDGITRDAPLDVAVVRVRHSFDSRGPCTTVIEGRGSTPAGYGHTWRGLGTGPGRARPGARHRPEWAPASWDYTPNAGSAEIALPLPAPRRWPPLFFWEIYASDNPTGLIDAANLRSRTRESTARISGPPGESGYVAIVGVDTEGNRDTSPANTQLIDYGQAGPSFLDPSVAWGGSVMLSRGFDVTSRGTPFPPDGWRMRTGVWGTDAAVSVTSELGTYSLELGTSGGATVVAMESTFSPVAEGTPYRALIRWQADSVTAGHTVTLQIEWYASKTGSLLSATTIHNAIAGAANTWQTASTAVEAPATAHWARVVVSKAAQSFLLTIDRVEFESTGETFEAVDSTTSLNSASWTLINLTTENHDLGQVFDLANDKFTAPGLAVWAFEASIRVSCDQWAMIGLFLNNNLFCAQTVNASNLDGSGEAWASVSTTRRLSAGDVVDVRGLASTSSGTPAVVEATFSGHRLHQ